MGRKSPRKKPTTRSGISNAGEKKLVSGLEGLRRLVEKTTCGTVSSNIAHPVGQEVNKKVKLGVRGASRHRNDYNSERSTSKKNAKR